MAWVLWHEGVEPRLEARCDVEGCKRFYVVQTLERDAAEERLSAAGWKVTDTQTICPEHVNVRP